MSLTCINLTNLSYYTNIMHFYIVQITNSTFLMVQFKGKKAVKSTRDLLRFRNA
jgi:hypothetical protein